MLAHRVSRGLGDWYLAASAWTPPLPGEVTVPVDAGGDLPDELAELVRVFRRLAPLGPVATLSRERVVHLIRGGGTADGESAGPARAVLGSVRDDRVTVRRGGVVISRSREVTLEPEPELSVAQRDHLVTVLQATGGSRVTGFPALAQRLGSPATRPTDIPAPRPRRAARTLGRVRVAAARPSPAPHRRGRPAGAHRRDHSHRLVKRLRLLDRDLTGLARLLDPGWHDAVQAHLTVVLAADPGAVTLWRHEDHYLAALDALVDAVQTPPVGERAGDTGRPRAQAAAPAARSTRSCRTLRRLGSTPTTTRGGGGGGRRGVRACRPVAAVVGGRRARDTAAGPDDSPPGWTGLRPAPSAPSPGEMAAMSPPEAFAAGRDVQRRVDDVLRGARGLRGRLAGAVRSGLGGTAGRR